jgi:hypothetical protein
LPSLCVLTFLVSKVCITNPQDTANEVDVITAIALQLAKQAEIYANELSDPVQKKKILQEASGGQTWFYFLLTI